MLKQSLLIAFSMYSKIPVPKAEWNEKNMKYAICFFPWVGATLGVLFIGLSHLLDLILLPRMLTGAILTALPVIITGGIHLDGYCDTYDAIASYQTIQKRHTILKDPHTGAFAVIHLVVYFIAFFATVTILNHTQILLAGICFFLSRSLSGLALVTFPFAKETGTAALFGKNADKSRVTFILTGYLVLIIGCIAVIDWHYIVPMLVTAFIELWYYYRMSMNKFGGICGDLAGYFLCKCELDLLLAIVIMERVIVYAINHWR